MAEILQVPCFRYHGQELMASLLVEPGDGAYSFITCPVRQRLVRLTPEERVRQAIVWFLITGGSRASVVKQHLRFGVEERSLDVAGLAAGNAIDERFAPYVTVVIIETKRQEEELSDHAGQLKNYMLRERCRAGLLFNGRQAMWLSLGGEFANPEWKQGPLTDLSDAEERVERVALEASSYVRDCRRAFAAAQGGDFDSFLRLVSLFGADTGLTFALSIRSKGSLGSVRAFNLGLSTDGSIGYLVRGVTTRHRQQLARAAFHSLLSILPL